MNKSGGVWWGVVLIAIGVLMLLDNMYVVDFGDILHTYWPVIFIIWGLSILGRRSSSSRSESNPSTGRVEGATSTVYPGSDANQLSSSTVFGDYRVAVQSKAFAGGNVSTTFGDTDIDLLNAQLAEGEYTLKLDGVFGNTWVHLPRDMAVAVFVNTTFGDARVNDQRKGGISSSLDYTSPDYHLATRRLRISVSRVFGNVTIVS
ncbi:MAG: putative rane protein [Bacteroidetes bacterium]|nr:putative rane protein [Bacteroidota bacterium]